MALSHESQVVSRKRLTLLNPHRFLASTSKFADTLMPRARPKTRRSQKQYWLLIISIFELNPRCHPQTLPVYWVTLSLMPFGNNPLGSGWIAGWWVGTSRRQARSGCHGLSSTRVPCHTYGARVEDNPWHPKTSRPATTPQSHPEPNEFRRAGQSRQANPRRAPGRLGARGVADSPRQCRQSGVRGQGVAGLCVEDRRGRRLTRGTVLD